MTDNPYQDNSGDNAASDDPIQSALDEVEAQFAPGFESVDVVVNPLYPADRLPTEPFVVVPFQVRAFNNSKPLAGIGATGRNAIFEGVALVNNGITEIYTDSMCILTELGIQVAMRPPIGLEREIELANPVPSTSQIAIDQEESLRSES